MATPPRSRPKALPRERDPLDWIKVAGLTEAEGFAVKAVATGTATPEQQRRAFEFIVARVARKDEPSFVLEKDGGERASAFAEGRRSVGLALAAIVALPAETLRRKDG